MDYSLKERLAEKVPNRIDLAEITSFPNFNGGQK